MQLFGLTLLFMSLCFDGGTGAYEDKLMCKHHVGPFDLMFNIQFAKMLLAGSGLVITGQITGFFSVSFGKPTKLTTFSCEVCIAMLSRVDRAYILCFSSCNLSPIFLVGVVREGRRDDHEPPHFLQRRSSKFYLRASMHLICRRSSFPTYPRAYMPQYNPQTLWHETDGLLDGACAAAIGIVGGAGPGVYLRHHIEIWSAYVLHYWCVKIGSASMVHHRLDFAA